MIEAEQLLNTLSGLRITPQPEEYQIHEMIAGLLRQAGIEYIHECKLTAGRRIDFLCGRIGIEVKKGKPDASGLVKQIQRYLESDMLDAIIVVTQRPCRLPAKILDKPVYLMTLNRLWGVALP